MNYELIMLKSLKQIKRAADGLKKRIRIKAESSYCTLNVKGGTIGQIEEIAVLIEKRNEYEELCQVVVGALKSLPRSYCVLLRKVYFNNVPCCKIAEKYNTSRSTVYRRVFQAREAFKDALLNGGCDERWFMENYGKLGFVRQNYILTVPKSQADREFGSV